ncbi:3-ketoacyl-ACP reductase [Emticicia sp. CRIBPO]|uniref:3-ketoacyl-ACP reductase n=1 Tax=Emticicia sp. CRIBPO TaxID=2683258 RepID=UPI001412E8E3|nr:3-ketoacyl-ACP reductase [Emticicia sp. CRIBPO]NBA85452.1 3-ketoacyl-ACP reductase [Emticicia sp. CRIBPO]
MRKTALVTGGSRGIGLGISEQLAKSGFDLAINGVRPEEGVSEMITHLKSYGGEVIYCQGNIGDKTDRQNIINKVRKSFGKLNLLVNNAGVAPKERLDILEATEESFDHVMGINLKGPYFLTQSIASWMVEQKETDPDFSGGIIYISSISATVASVNRGEYCLSKAGISMASQLFAVRMGEFGIPVYEVRPGIIKSDMTAGVTAKYDQLIENGLTVQKRWGLPEDVGKVVASIAREDFSYSTGQVFMVDGGLTLSRL